MKREPLHPQRTLFRGLGRGKTALEADLAARHGLVAGVDEVGRGCLAGPVVAAAVILPAERKIRGITDSKLLSPGRREALDVEIRRHALAVTIGVVEAPEIDRVNILNASLRAMAHAIAGLDPQPAFLLVDGTFKVPGVAVPQQVVVKGDLRCRCIGAASIVAKVHRDRLMRELDAAHPGYGFAEHKGYGAPAHRRALETLGPTPIHRRSFFGVLPYGADEEQEVLAFERASRAHLVRGREAEDRALAWLAERGWTLLDRNWRCPAGELDLVVAREKVLAFVEVKMRQRAGGFHPVDAMTPAKRRALTRAAHAWLGRNASRAKPLHPRFDVITVVGSGPTARVEHLEGAFEAADGG